MEQQDIRSPGIERLTYWPSSRKFAFQFSNDYALHGKWIVCPAVKVEKTSMGYVPCTTEFKGAAGLNGTRTLVGVMTLGLSELAGVANSKEQFVIDEEALSAVVNRFDLDKKIADYMRAEPTKVALAAKQAPVANSDSLARQAELETNVNVLREAVKSVGDVASYQRRFTPTHPERYCDEFKSDMGMLASCKATVRQTVTNLAYDRAVAARRHDSCARVSMAVTKITQKDICHQYKSSGACSGSTPLEIKTCNILLSKG